MARYPTNPLNWPKFKAHLQAYQAEHKLSNTLLAKRLHISLGTLTRYYNGERHPKSEVFAYALLLMGRDLREYISLPVTS